MKSGYFYTLFEIFIFCPKIQLWFPEKIVDFFVWKTLENVAVLDFLAVDNFDFTRKIGWKTRENVSVLSKLNFWTKIWLSNSAFKLVIFHSTFRLLKQLRVTFGQIRGLSPNFVAEIIQMRRWVSDFRF